MRAYFIALRFVLLRIVRAPVSWILLFLMPMALIPILGIAFSAIPADNAYLKAAPSAMSFFAIMLVVMFQLFGGGYSLEFIRDDLLTPRKWRIHALPHPAWVFVLATVTMTTIFSVAQGLALVLLTKVVLGVGWGNFGVVACVLLATALLTQLYHVVFVIAVRNVGFAQGLVWVVNYGSVVLGGGIFPLPDANPFFHFTMTYGSPFSLAQRAILQSLKGGPSSDIALCIGVLLAAALVCGGIVALLGRRRLA